MAQASLFMDIIAKDSASSVFNRIGGAAAGLGRATDRANKSQTAANRTWQTTKRLLLGLGTLGLPPLASSSGDRADLVPLLLGVLAVVLAAAAVVWFVPKVRAGAAHLLGQLREALTVLRSPSAVARLFLYNVLAQVLFSIAIWIVLEAFGQQVAITDVIIINVAVALFAGLMPVPGGVGVTEGALTAGFVAVGVPQATALGAALCYRLITFYLPPLWGYVALRSLRRDGFL